MTAPVMECAADQTCVVQTQQTCLTPPCLPWGQCVPSASVVRDTTPPGADASCLPNAAQLTTTCARIQLIFDMSKMPMVSCVICLGWCGFKGTRSENVR